MSRPVISATGLYTPPHSISNAELVASLNAWTDNWNDEHAAEIAAGDHRITGLMIESHLEEGRQDIVPGQPLKRGVSVTDACISLAQTVPVLQGLAAAVQLRRSHANPHTAA
mgnify:CR=1 FL=1